MYLLTFFSDNTFCHLQLIYHMRLVLGDYKDFSCKMSFAIKILLQTLVENTQFSFSGRFKWRTKYHKGTHVKAKGKVIRLTTHFSHT
jgi:hypothetical protein